MPSIRRTLSPALHPHHNRALSDFFSTETKEKDQMVNSSPRSSSSSPHHSLRLFFSIAAGLRPIAPMALRLFLPKPSSRKRLSYWKRSLLRFFFFFLLGFLLRLSPFFDLDLDLDLNTSISSPIRSEISSARRELGTIFRRPSAESGLKEIVSVPPLAALTAPKLLIIVTPTYNRALQSYYLHRLGQMLRLVQPPLLWIVVEMSSASEETAEVLRLTGVMYRHLVCHKDSVEVKDRGVHQRNAALEHIERHRLDGIVYFADDDNIYSLQLFSQLRDIRRFGTWPVAMLAQSKSRTILEGPVCNGSKVIGWNTNEKSKKLRRFHVDMSGFAYNSTTIWDPNRWHRPASNSVRQLDTVKEGFQETSFIEQVVEDESQMEGLPHGCSMIMNWHLHLEARYLVYPRGWQVSRSLDAVISLKEDI